MDVINLTRLNVSLSEKSTLKHSNVIVHYIISLLSLKNAIEAKGKGEIWEFKTPGSLSSLTPQLSLFKLWILSAPGALPTLLEFITLPSSDVLHHTPWEDHCNLKFSLPKACPARSQVLGPWRTRLNPVHYRCSTSALLATPVLG